MDGGRQGSDLGLTSVRASSAALAAELFCGSSQLAQGVQAADLGLVGDMGACVKDRAAHSAPAGDEVDI